MARLQLLVDGVDLTRYADQDGWSVSQNWSRQGDTASFMLTDEQSSRGSLSFTINPLTTIQLTDLDLGQVLFSGIVTKPAVKFPAPTLAVWSLDCADWTYLSDRTLVVGDYSGRTADELAVIITQAANCGIVAAATTDGGYVSPGAQIPRIQFNYTTLTNAWTQLSKLASVAETYGWYVDEQRNLHFNTLTQAADSGITFSDNIAAINTTTTIATTDTTFGYEWDATSIRNTITVRGADYSQQQTDLFVGDGSTAQFPLTFTPDSQNLGSATLTVGGVAKTVAAATGDSANTDWLLQANAARQWFLLPNTDPTPAASVIIQLTYPFLQPAVVQLTDPTSVGRWSGLPNGGRFGYLIADTSLPTLLAAQQRAQREVATYAQPSERIQVDATEHFTGHFRAGQLITVTNGVVPDSQRNNQAGVADQFLVVQLNIAGVGGGYRTYAATAVRV